MHELFLQLTSLTQTPKLKRLFQSPFGMHEMVLAKLAREAEHARAGRPARVIAKMNALVDPQAIEALYRASRAGVKIELIVRGVCALRPGIPGVSQNITVRSIVGRFLEHSRVFYFHNGGEWSCSVPAPTGWSATSSAAWRWPSPSAGATSIERIVRDLELCLADNCQAWELRADGHYERIGRGEGRPLSVQAELLAAYAAGTSSIG